MGASPWFPMWKAANDVGETLVITAGSCSCAAAIGWLPLTTRAMKSDRPAASASLSSDALQQALMWLRTRRHGPLRSPQENRSVSVDGSKVCRCRFGLACPGVCY